MPLPIKILYLAAEAEPFIKVGGLGDVSGSLPNAIQNLSELEKGGLKTDIRLVLPLHKVIQKAGLLSRGSIVLQRGREALKAEVYETHRDGCPVYFIDGEPIQSSSGVYSADARLDGEKFIFFSLAVLELPKLIRWTPDILHANDWHTALAVYASKIRSGNDHPERTARLITVHNLVYIGPEVSGILRSYGIKQVPTNLPVWANQHLLPLGMWSADAISTVSPSFASQMFKAQTGGDLRNFFKSRKDSLLGILNGLDTRSYDPATDPALDTPFDLERIKDRMKNKTALRAQLDLSQDEEGPLLAMVSRMDRQKGVDLVLRVMKTLDTEAWQIVILGTGDPYLERKAAGLEKQLPDKVRVLVRFDEAMARRIYAGADCLLMPSRYEPCGLSQMIAMRYGCVPLVRATGGLKDTVRHMETGILFNKPNTKDLTEAIRIVLRLYREKTIWTRIQINAMEQDFSWSRSAQKYFNLYRDLYYRTRVKNT